MIGKTKETLTRPRMTEAEREQVEKDLEKFKAWAADIEATNGDTSTYYHEQVRRLSKALRDDAPTEAEKAADKKDEVTS